MKQISKFGKFETIENRNKFYIRTNSNKTTKPNSRETVVTLKNNKRV